MCSAPAGPSASGFPSLYTEQIPQLRVYLPPAPYQNLCLTFKALPKCHLLSSDSLIRTIPTTTINNNTESRQLV